MLKYIHVGEECYDSYPCQHMVTMETIDGKKKETMMNGREIGSLMMNNLDVETNVNYKFMRHFEYLFGNNRYHSFIDGEQKELKEIQPNKEFNDYLNQLKLKPKKIQIIFDPKLLENKESKSEITMSLHILRRVLDHNYVIHKLPKENNYFYINSPDYKSENDMYKGGYFMKSFTIIDKINKHKCYPEKVELMIDNILVKTWYCDIMKTYDINLIPLFVLQNKQIKIPTLIQLGRNSGICENELRQTIVSLIDDGTIFVEDKTTIKIQNK